MVALSRPNITPHLDRGQCLRLAAEALVDQRTIARWYDGGSVRALTHQRLLEAARRLGYPVPTVSIVIGAIGAQQELEEQPTT